MTSKTPNNDDAAPTAPPAPPANISALLSTEHPHKVRYASNSWLEMVGLPTLADAMGRTLSFLIGSGTDREQLQQGLSAVCYHNESFTTRLIMYDKHGTPFAHTLHLEPVLAAIESGPGLIRATSSDVVRIGVPMDSEGNPREDDILRKAGSNMHLAAILDDGLDAPLQGVLFCDGSFNSLAAATSLGNLVPLPALTSLVTLPSGACGEYSVITTGGPSHKVLWASPSWLALCEFGPCELVGRSLRLIQGPGTDANVVRALMKGVREEQPTRVTLINYSKNMRPFKHTLLVVPVKTASGTFFRGTSTEVCELNAGEYGLVQRQRSLDSLSLDDEVWDDDMEDYLEKWRAFDKDCAGCLVSQQ